MGAERPAGPAARALLTTTLNDAGFLASLLHSDARYRRRGRLSAAGSTPCFPRAVPVTFLPETRMLGIAASAAAGAGRGGLGGVPASLRAEQSRRLSRPPAPPRAKKTPTDLHLAGRVGWPRSGPLRSSSRRVSQPLSEGRPRHGARLTPRTMRPPGRRRRPGHPHLGLLLLPLLLLLLRPGPAVAAAKAEAGRQARPPGVSPLRLPPARDAALARSVGAELLRGRAPSHRPVGAAAPEPRPKPKRGRRRRRGSKGKPPALKGLGKCPVRSRGRSRGIEGEG